MEITDYIKQSCEKRKVSVASVARQVGNSPQNFFNKTKRNTFQTRELVKIADALGADLDIRFIDRETGKPLL